MIKATLRDGDGTVKVLLLGLSHSNLDRLRDGEPLRFNTSEVEMPPLDVFLFSASTEKQIIAEFERRGMITEQTIRHGEPDS